MNLRTRCDLIRLTTHHPEHQSGAAEFKVLKLFCSSMLAIAITTIAIQAQSPSPPQFNSLIMLSTVKVLGPSVKEPGKIAIGTGFIIGRPDVNDQKSGAQMLVTAAHVFEEISGDECSLVVRREKSDGTYERTVIQAKLRENGRPRYVKHPTADVAAMYSQIPQIKLVTSADMLVDDAMMKQYEVTTGDEVQAAGYPLGVEGPQGFPILRSGQLSSFPLLPMASVKQFLINYNVLPGNSGGPVYLQQRARWLTSTKSFWSVSIILGLVSQQMRSDPEKIPLEVAIVVPANFIRETIALLPEPVF
jgi:hypothetical protein